jgi:hypothetical protein
VLLQRFIDALADVSKVDQPMKMEGRFLGVLLAPESKKVAKKKAPSADQPQEAAAPDAQPTPITQ